MLQIKTFKDYYNYVIKDNVQSGDVVLVCVTVRKKYMNEEEKLIYNIPSNSFFNRKLVAVNDGKYLFNNLEKTIYELKNKTYYDRDYKVLPENCISVYIKLNPSSIKKSLTEVTKKFMGILMDNDIVKINKFQSMLNTEFQKNDRIRNFLDIDCDIYTTEDEANFREFALRLENKCDYRIIKSKNGYHIIINKRTFVAGFQLHNVVKKYNDLMIHEKSEIEFSNGKLLPLNIII